MLKSGFLSRSKSLRDGAPGHANGDPFGAFLLDVPSRSIVTKIAAGLGIESSAIEEGSVADAARTFGAVPAPNILLVDISESGNALADVAALRQGIGSSPALICIGTSNDLTLYRSLIAGGATEYLVKPLEPNLLRATLLNAQRGPEIQTQNQARGRLAVILGTRGGVGASTVTANLGWLLAEVKRRRTVLVDLDLQFGSVALLLDVEAGVGLQEALNRPEQIDELFIERALRAATERLQVLATEELVDNPLDCEPAALHVLFEHLRGRFDWTLVDLPRFMALAQQEALAAASDVVLVTDLSLAGLRDTIRLRRLVVDTAPTARLWMIANAAHGDRGQLKRKEYETALKAKLDAVLPADAVIAARSAAEGSPVVRLAARSALGKALRSFVEQLGENEPAGSTGIREAKK
jgi:pilus assembly protein CpaE